MKHQEQHGVDERMAIGHVQGHLKQCGDDDVEYNFVKKHIGIINNMTFYYIILFWDIRVISIFHDVTATVTIEIN